MRVATRACTEYNEGKVAWLSGIEHVKMEEVFSADYIKSAKDMRAAEAAGILRLSPVPSGKQRREAPTDNTSSDGNTAQVMDVTAPASETGTETDMSNDQDDAY